MLDRMRRREDAVASGLSFSRRIMSLTAVVTVEEKGEGEINGLDRWLADLELCAARGVTGRSVEYDEVTWPSFKDARGCGCIGVVASADLVRTDSAETVLAPRGGSGLTHNPCHGLLTRT